MTAQAAVAGNPVEHIDAAWHHRGAMVQDLADRYGTPLYVYDADVAGARVDLLRSVLSRQVDLYYSVKANPCPGVHRAFRERGCGFEVASVGELRVVRDQGVAAEHTILVGPSKSRDLLRRARGIGVGLVVLESPGELDRLRTVVRDDGGPAAQVALRLNPGHGRGALRMGGSSPFGMSQTDAERSLALSAGWPEVRVRGFHGFLASSLLDAADVVANCHTLLDAVTSLAPLLPEPMSFLDVGGGFGIPYHAGDAALDLGRLRGELRSVVARARDELRVRASFEAGRFLVGPAGILVCRVVDMKVNVDRRFVVLDGGSNVCGLFTGRYAGRSLPFQVVRGGTIVDGGHEPATICGPLCTPLDRMATSVACGAQEGDLIVWHQCGAYGASAGLSDFLSFERPVEVVIEDAEPVWRSGA